MLRQNIYYRESIAENKSTSDIWKQLKEMTTKYNDSTITHMTHNGVTTQNPQEMANMYNDYITFLSKRILKNDLILFETDTI